MGRRQRNQSQGKDRLMLMSRMIKGKQKNPIEVVPLTILAGKGSIQRTRGNINQGRKIKVIMTGIGEDVHLQLVVEVEPTRIVLSMPVIQVVKDQMAQKGSCIQESVTYHRLLSDLKEDNFRGLLIASVLSAGILPILLLILPGEGGQDPDHLFGGRDERWKQKRLSLRRRGSFTERSIRRGRAKLVISGLWTAKGILIQK